MRWISAQSIVFSPLAEQRVDVLIAGVRGVPVEREVLPVADPSQQLKAEQVREGVHRVALALGVGVDRVRLGADRFRSSPSMM